jgi:hypothetical protein
VASGSGLNLGRVSNSTAAIGAGNRKTYLWFWLSIEGEPTPESTTISGPPMGSTIATVVETVLLVSARSAESVITVLEVESGILEWLPSQPATATRRTKHLGMRALRIFPVGSRDTMRIALILPFCTARKSLVRGRSGICIELTVTIRTSPL